MLRFTGDGIKAAFGSQGSREDDAERAVRAGLQMLSDAAVLTERVRRDLGFEGFGARVGIHTGPVLLGGGFEAERSAMGRAVHLAARMEQSAPVGRLRISEGTWMLVRGRFVAEEQPPLTVKGHDEPLRTWLVEAVIDEPEPPHGGLEGIAVPLVGRDAELTQLLTHRAASIEAGRSGAALVLADAGFGKTRLRRELLRALDLREGSPGLLQARANPSSVLQPYGLVRQLLARAFGISDDLAADAARAHLHAGLTPWLGAHAEGSVACIGHLIGLDFGEAEAVRSVGAAELRTRAFEALREALHAMARVGPLTIVLEDLHWADDASLEFVRTLLAPHDVPLWILLLARPTLLEGGRRLPLPASPHGVRLDLGALPESAGRALLDGLLAPLQDAPETLKQALLERAEGNPLFLEALVRMLIDDGVIDASGHPWRLRSEELAALRVPPTLVGVLQARLDALPPLELRALQSASIIGPVFWHDALHAVDAHAVAALPALLERNLVVRRAASAFADVVEYRFAHQLLQETAYGTVLQQQRRDGHARLAQWLAGRVADRAGEFLAITAQHYEQAGDSAAALDYWDRAQADAVGRFAHDAALHFIDRALAQPALTDARWHSYLLSTRYKVLQHLARQEEADAALAALEQFAQAQDDAVMRAEAKGHRMLRADYEGRPAEALALAQEIIALCADAADELAAPALSLAYGELAWLAAQEGRSADVERLVETGIEQARIAERLPRRLGRPIGRENSLRSIAIGALIEQARFVEAIEAIAVARAAAGTKLNAYDRFNLMSREWLALRGLGRLDEAWALTAELRRLAEVTGIVRLQAPPLLSAAEIALLRGDHETAEAMLERAAEAVAKVDGGFDVPWLQELRGRLALARGDRDGSRAAWLEAISANEARGREAAASQLGCELALVELRCGNAESARARVEAALAFVASDPARQPLGPEALVAAVAVLESLGDPRAASLRGELRRRLEQQLVQLDRVDDRRRLVSSLPAWRDAVRLLGDAHLLDLSSHAR